VVNPACRKTLLAGVHGRGHRILLSSSAVGRGRAVTA
jgi:hypothetical protein